MKKIVSLILALLIVMSLGVNLAFATTESSVVITARNHNITTGEVTVSGKVADTRGSIPLMLTVEKGGVVIYLESGVTAPINNDTNYDDDNTFTFNAFRFTEDCTDGTYKFTVYARHINKSSSFEIEYVPNSVWYGIIKTVNDNKAVYDAATTDVTKQTVLDTVTAHIQSNILKTDLDSALYTTLSSNAKALISKTAVKNLYSIPATWAETEANVIQLSGAVAAFKAACAEGMVYAQLHDSFVSNDASASKTAFDAWYALNKTGLGLEAENGATAISENQFMTTVFPTIYNSLNFYKRLPSIANETNSLTLQKAFIDAVILTKVNDTPNATTLRPFVNTYKGYIGVNTTLWGNDNNTTAQSTALGAVVGKSYDTLALLASAIDGGFSTGGNNGNNGNNNIYSGTTSVGGNTGVVTGVINNNGKQPVSSDEAPFEDLDGYDWARDAIDFLYRREIISGRDEKTFDPAGLVTRAEFIKMLTLTYNFNAADKEAVTFGDVGYGDWFAQYVKTAAAMGVVTGDENGNFNPGAHITRQDMAVTVFRASAFPDATRALEFADAAYISDYAKAAVASLYEKGIVAGMGDMSFAPLENVTRAQAAQILYNVLAETSPEEVRR